MKQVLHFLLFIIPIFSFSQSKITVVAADTKKPVAKATIYCNDQLIGTTDPQGHATVKTKCTEIDIEAEFFDAKTVKITKELSVELQPSSERTRSIQKVVLQDKSDQRALRILDEAEKRYKNNSPESLDSYNFKSYSKISIDLDKDSVQVYRDFMQRRTDSLAALPPKDFKQKNGDKKDSLRMEEFNNAGKNSQFFMWEKAQLHQYSKQFGEKVSVLDSRISGLQNPLYEFMALSISNLGKMPRILKSENRRLYRFFLTDTVEIGGRKNFVINYRTLNAKNQNRRKFNGSIYIDTDSYAIAKIESKSRKAAEGKMLAIWKPIDGKWFLVTEDIVTMAGKQVFDTQEQKKDAKKQDKDAPKKGQKKFGSYLAIKNNFFDFETNIAQKSEDFKGYTYEVKNSGGDKLEDFRTAPLTEREQNTYTTIDSLSDKLKLEKKLNQLTSLIKGNVRLGKVDFDLGKLIDYNRYEGLRLGLGAKLNEKFNPIISPDAYFGYGFKDHTWKYGAGVDFRMSKVRNSILRADYVNDVGAVAKFNRDYWGNTSILDNLASNVNNSNFFAYKGFGVSWRYDATNTLAIKLGANYQKQNALFDYSFKDQENRYTDFKTSLALQYSPNDKNIMTPSGKFTFESGYPKFYLNLEKGLKTFGGNLNYTRVEATAMHQFKTKIGTTTAKLYGGLSSGTAPVWKEFEISGLTDAGSRAFLGKVSLETPFAFYTMPAGTFYADKFAALEVVQRLPFTFKTFGRRISWLDATYSSAIGGFKNPEFHRFNFTPLNHYYQEAGLVWHNFLGSRYSVGLHYRLGHYQAPKFIDNLGIQIGLF